MPPFHQPVFTPEDFARPEGKAGLALAALMHQSNASMTYKAAETLDLQAGNKLLEIGHGNGAHITELHRRHPDISYTGIDHSHTLHAHCAENPALQALDCEFIEGKARQYNLPFEEGSFNALLAVNMVYFYGDIAAAIHEYARVLKSGGRVAIAFKDKTTLESAPISLDGLHLYQPQTLCDVLNDSGFNEIGVLTHSEDVLRFDGSWAERTYHIITATHT